MRFVLGIVILIILGFVIFTILASLGFMMVMVVKALPLWKVLLGTLLGSALAFTWIVEGEYTKK